MSTCANIKAMVLSYSSHMKFSLWPLHTTPLAPAHLPAAPYRAGVAALSPCQRGQPRFGTKRGDGQKLFIEKAVWHAQHTRVRWCDVIVSVALG